MRVTGCCAATLLLAALLCAAAGPAHAGGPELPGRRRRGLSEGAPSPAAATLQPTYASDRVIITFKPDVVAAAAAEAEGLAFQKPAGLNGAAVYTITDGQDVASKVVQLQVNPAVAVVEPDYKVKVQWKPDDTYYSMQWHHPKISSERAWDTVTGSTVVKVCHVDSGVRVDHPDLAANVLKGWNFAQGSPPPKAGTPEYFNYNDTYGHGSHTAGLIAAVGNNKLGVAGVNWRVQMLVCRFIWDDGTGYVSDAMNCLKLCKQEGALITSNSWGGIGYSSFLEREIATTQSSGQLFVVAAGNLGVDLDEVPLYPASYKTDNMISVAASDSSDKLADFSNIGQNTVHLAAPGESIYSTARDGGYVIMHGTSMACPLVAGAAALLQAAATSRGVTLSYGEMKSLIVSSVDKVPGAANKTITGGRLNVAAAMSALDALLTSRGVPKLATPSPSPPPPSPPPPPPPSPPTQPSGSATVATSPGVVCGTTSLAGLNSATQSSTAGSAKANLAIDGECRKRRVWQGSCSQTSRQASAWWAVKLPAPKTLLSLSIQTASDCNCAVDLVGAKIMVGNTPWTSKNSAANFTLCANITGILRGQRKTFTCAADAAGVRPRGQYIAILRPGVVKRVLTLCEVDAVFAPDTPIRRIARQLYSSSSSSSRGVEAASATAQATAVRRGGGLRRLHAHAHAHDDLERQAQQAERLP
ncbi:hypothetical protein ABPG75_007287 [Micractinium tetrahymenae]